MSNTTEVIPIISANLGGNIRLQTDRLIDKTLTADYHFII
jgi:hypothetical protein